MLKVSLIVVQGKPEGAEVPVMGPVFRIGRDPSYQLRPDSEEVSRRHAEITITDASVTVQDMGSRNGTFVNGNQLTAPHTLKSGELLKIGQLTFAVLIQEAVAKILPAGPPRTTPPVETRGKSSDVVEQDKIKTWLVADNTRPTPDRPSGVFDGDTLTLDAYSGGSGTVPSAKAAAAPLAPKAATPPPAAAPKPPSAPAMPSRPMFGEDHGEFERLEEGAGDVGDDGEEMSDDSDAEDDSNEEYVDESNPFHVAKKAMSKADDAVSKKSYSDTSDAANDILRKLMDRRRASKS